jgi:hypothetical protein
MLHNLQDLLEYVAPSDTLIVEQAEHTIEHEVTWYYW